MTILDTKDFFSLNAFNFQDDFFEIKLKFPPHMRDYIIERVWFPDQKLKPQKGGGIQLSFESDLNMMVIGWIRGFGSDVKVLGPKELIEQLLDDLKHNLRQYF